MQKPQYDKVFFKINESHWTVSYKKWAESLDFIGFAGLYRMSPDALYVPGMGLEPIPLAGADFKSATSTDFVTRASLAFYRPNRRIATRPKVIASIFRASGRKRSVGRKNG